MGGGMPGVGGGGATGKVYQLKDTQLSDDGTAIPSYYTTHYFPERAVEQSLSLGAHRKLFSYLTMFVEGAGKVLQPLPSGCQGESMLTVTQLAPLKDLHLLKTVLRACAGGHASPKNAQKGAYQPS
jgi:hypothetical protein